MGCAISTTSAPEGIQLREDTDREVVPRAAEVLGTKGDGEDSAIIKGCIKEKDWDPQHIQHVSGGAWSSGPATFSEMVPPMSRVIDVKGDSTPLYREQALVPARPSEVILQQIAGACHISDTTPLQHFYPMISAFRKRHRP
jgi:hypothetical protein